MSHVASAQPASSRSISSGRAEVVRSRSLCCRPSIASRTGPPTSASSCPAAAKRVPSSSITGAMRSSSAATSRWASASRTLPGGRRSAASDTERQPSGERRPRVATGPALQSGRAPPVVAVARPGRAGRRRCSSRSARPRGCPSSPAYAASAGPPDPTQPLVLRMRSITPDYIPDQRPDHHPGHDHQRLRRGVDGDQRGGLLRLDPDHHHRPSSRRRRRPRSTPTSAIGSPSPARSTTSTPCSPARRRPFTVRLPRSKIPVSAPGVYWFGVHALGATAEGRSSSAAGRDRTFLPLVPASVTASGQVEQTSLVLPVRAGVVRAPDGTIEDTEQWLHSLRTGALHDLVTTGQAARRPTADLGGRPCRASTSYAGSPQGNPPRTLATPTTKNPDGGPSPSPSDGATSSGSAASTSDDAPLASALTPGRPAVAAPAPRGPVGRHRPGDGPAVRRPRGRHRPPLRPAAAARGDPPHRPHPASLAGAAHADRGAARRPDGRGRRRRPAHGRAPCSWRTPGSAAPRPRPPR